MPLSGPDNPTLRVRRSVAPLLSSRYRYDMGHILVKTRKCLPVMPGQSPVKTKQRRSGSDSNTACVPRPPTRRTQINATIERPVTGTLRPLRCRSSPSRDHEHWSWKISACPASASEHHMAGKVAVTVSKCGQPPRPAPALMLNAGFDARGVQPCLSLWRPEATS